MKRLIAFLLLACLLLSACGRAEVEEDATVGYKPPEVVGGTTQTTDVEVKGEEPKDDGKTTVTEKTINGNKVPVGDYTGKFPVITEQNNFSVFSLNMNGVDDRKTENYGARVQALMALLVQLKPDVITLQEAGSTWMDFIVPQLDGIYDYYLIYPNDGDKADANPIFFKTEKFQDTTGGCFWISDTPEQPSAAVNGKYYNCTWLELQEKGTENKIHVFNSRLDAAVGVQGAVVIRGKCDAAGWRKAIVCSVDLGEAISGAAGQILQKNLIDSNAAAKTDATVKAGGVKDFSLYTKIYLTPVSYSVLNGYDLSDHNPLFTHYSINTETLNYEDQFIF
ncbi:MAG: hypothetical protein IJP27_03235 [Clostridia bacterium]|nr:hypothetical protein [Clostridia bacterium]